jgi:hypothetical protein
MRTTVDPTRDEIERRGVFPRVDTTVPTDYLERMLHFDVDTAKFNSQFRLVGKDHSSTVQVHVQKQCSHCTKRLSFPQGLPRSSICCPACTADAAYTICQICVLEQVHAHPLLLFTDGTCQGQVVYTASFKPAVKVCEGLK